MITYSVNKVAAYVQRIADLFTRYKTDLIAKGFDPTGMITTFPAQASALPVTDVAQEDAKSSQTAQTSALTDDAQAAYANANNALYSACGFLGRSTPEGKEGQRIRATVKSPKSGPQVAVFIQDVVVFLTNHSDALKARNYDPTAKIAELTALSPTLMTEKGQQEQKKSARSNATKAVDSAKDALYNDANTALLGAMGLFPADSEFVAEARRIRLEIHGPTIHAKQPPAPATQPTTAPPPA